MKKDEQKKKITLGKSKLIQDLEKLADLCKENKIEQLKLPDGTCIVMSQLAFYAEVLPETVIKREPSTISGLDIANDLGQSIDDETLFMSAR